MFVDKGYQEHGESNKEFNSPQKFPIYGKVLSQIFGQNLQVSQFISSSALTCFYERTRSFETKGVMSLETLV